MAAELWTVRRILDWTVGFLESRGDEHPRLSAEWLLSDATGLSRVELYMSFDRPLMEPELAIMREGVRRRGAGEPLQYVTGEMPFRHIVLRCERGVLIPRPETEILVDAALEGLARIAGARAVWGDPPHAWGVSLNDPSLNDPRPGDPSASHPMPRVLEVGTGTGCIACSIATERKDAIVIATDLSPQAARLARRNADALGVGGRVDVVECDLADGVPDELMGTFSVLVSNPPYIPSDVLPLLPVEVRGFEPGLALDGGDDGLDVFRRILDLAQVALVPGGMLCVELFEENVHVAADLVREQGGWAQVEVRDDLTHRPRVLVAWHE